MSVRFLTNKDSSAHQMPVTDADGKVKWEDRTHYAYTGTIEFLPENVPVFVEDNGAFAVVTPFSKPLELGMNCTVTYNGVEYKCPTQEMYIDPDDPPMIAVGDAGAMTGGDSTGEPFLLVQAPEGGGQGIYALVVPLDGAESVTIKIVGEGEIVHPLDKKYFSDSLKGQKTINVYLDADGSATCDTSFDVAWTMDDGELQSALLIHSAGGATTYSAFAVGKYENPNWINMIQFSFQGPTDAPPFRVRVYTWYEGYGLVQERQGQVLLDGSGSDNRFLVWGGSGWGDGTADEHSDAYEPAYYRMKSTTGIDPKHYMINIDDDRNINLYEGIPSDKEQIDTILKASDLDADKIVSALGYTPASSADVGSDNTIPTYWLTHLNERIPAIRSAMAAAGWKKSAFLWYHDVHWTYGYKKAPMLLKYLYQHTPINKTVFGGDIVDNEGDDTTMSYLWDWRNAVRNIPNHHSVPGNHDDGNTTDNLWDDPYIYSYLLAAEETPDVVRGDAGLYYYIDDPTEKTRYLYLDTATKDGNIINDTVQQAWLKATLKSTPAGWHIVAIGHIWRTVDYDVTPPADSGWSYGGAYCIGEFDKYNARTGDYASCAGKVEFCIGGHTHVDADFTSDGGIPVILTECDARYIRSGLDCTEGTITEASVNAIVADYTNGKVEVIRIGRGSSRTVNLDGSGSTEGGDDNEGPGSPGGEDTPVVPEGNFTNVLTAVGYTENTRYSTSSKSETTATGWDITGYIAATRGSVIRMANVTFFDLDGGGGATSRAQVYMYDSSKAYVAASSNYSPDSLMSDAWSAVYSEDGDLIQFTIPTSYDASVAYIRINARNIDQYSVITVDEEISSDSDYIQTEAETVAYSVNQHQSNDSIVFPFLADAHCGYYTDTTNEATTLAGQLLYLIGQSVQYDFIVHGGDMANGAWDTTRAMTYEQIEDYTELMSDANQGVPSIWIPGNHDDSPYMATADRVTQEEMYDLIGSKNLSSGAICPDGCNYGYLDLESKHLRVIYLDTDDKRSWGTVQVGNGETAPAYLNAHNVSGDQLRWLATTALDFSAKDNAADWDIVVVSHVALNVSGTTTDAVSGTSYAYSTVNAATILSDYSTGNGGSITHNGVTVQYDFSTIESRAFVICCVHGHNHKFCNETVGGIMSIGCPNVMNGRERASSDGNTYTKTAGTAEGTSFCIITIDRENSMVYADCVGVGPDRAIAYTTEDLSYTNLLPISTDASGSVYNVKGYKEDTYLSSGNDGTKTGIYASGFIPGVMNEYGTYIWYFKNVGMTNGQDSHRLCIYDGSKTYVTTVKTAIASTFVYGDDGNITRWSCNSSDYPNGVYIRICCGYLGADSIITANEPIE